MLTNFIKTSRGEKFYLTVVAMIGSGKYGPELVRDNLRSAINLNYSHVTYRSARGNLLSANIGIVSGLKPRIRFIGCKSFRAAEGQKLYKWALR